jgi:hypothetical protein
MGVYRSNRFIAFALVRAYSKSLQTNTHTKFEELAPMHSNDIALKIIMAVTAKWF